MPAHHLRTMGHVYVSGIGTRGPLKVSRSILVSTIALIVLNLLAVYCFLNIKRECPTMNITEPKAVRSSSGISQYIMSRLLADHQQAYDLSYWDWQAGLGELGGLLERWKFDTLIPTGSNCVDFGAGGGFLLHNMPDNLCRNKTGVEINPHARGAAMDNFHIRLVNHSMFLDDNWADVIFSNHALEHVLCPWCELVQLKGKLKPDTGRIIFVVPHAGQRDAWAGSTDVNMHINTWSPNVLGHMFTQAGFHVLAVDILRHQWPGSLPNMGKDLLLREGTDAFIKAGQEENAKNPLPGCEVQLRIVASRSK